jgi:hypothetical protein
MHTRLHTHALHAPLFLLCLTAALDEEESGWKYIHGDVFRFPPHKNVFCAFVGTGTQVCV